ncbi:unnamed protein product [Macrosiphum euphorbiae]|uniref:Polyprotein n=1 Tax=Macrosiphum euphorbiae TaxID=13131 RepID=A0AAV0VS53_9HEMI|nr:unnamed protein product [Macrosiphum euphorbiae]
MYRQILIRQKDRTFQHIFWRDSPTDDLVEFQLCTVTYGLNCAPYLAIRCLHELDRQDGHRFPLAKDVLTRAAYVDDIVIGADTQELLLRRKEDVVGLLRNGACMLSKWTSNSTTVLESVSPDDRVLSISFDPREEHAVKVLGLHWDTKTDKFAYHTRLDQISLTKRQVLSVIARLFDPIGALGPMLLWAKYFMQLLWCNKLGWDDLMSPELQSMWQQFCTELPLVFDLNLPRHIDVICHQDIQLLGFADASIKGYAAVVYLRLVNTAGDISVKFITCKTKVAPLKSAAVDESLSIPRLELCGALLLAQTLHHVQSVLSTEVSISRLRAWSDSSVVLSWLTTDQKQFKIFVTNRVAKIRQLLPDCVWSYVSTLDNPADPASRGLMPKLMLSSSIYWDGPEFLRIPEDQWPPSRFIPLAPEQLPDTRPNVVATLAVNVHPSSLDFIGKFSSLEKMLRVLSYVSRFLSHRLRRQPIRVGPITFSERERSLSIAVQRTQQYYFSDLVKTLKNKSTITPPSLAQLAPYIDDNNIVRVGGRLRFSNASYDAKHPILLPRSSHLTDLVIRHYHLSFLHGGSKLVLSMLNQKYWILSGRAAVRRVIFSCVPCTRHKAVRPQPLMADLPSYRVQPHRPFSHVGCLFNRNVCSQRELCHDDHAFGKCIPKYDNGAGEYTYKLIMNNLMILREDMKFLYYNGYSWPHPFTQCVLQHRLKLIRYSLPPVDNSICNQYLRVNDGRQNDGGDFADFYKQPDVYVGAEDIGQDREYYPDIDYEYRRNIINRNRLQGTPLYLPWMPGSKQQQYDEDPNALVYGQPRFRPDYNTPEGFRAGEEMKDKMDDEWKKLRQMEMLSKGIDNSNKAYTEGGLVFLPKKGANGEEDEVMFSDFINNYDSESGWAGFKRPERLDVKKPGPFFKLNNFVKNEEESEPKPSEDITKTVDATTLLGTNRKTDSDDIKSTNPKTSTKLTQDDFKTIYVSKITPEEEKYGQKKEKTKDKMDDTDNDNYEVVDTSYVCIRLKDKISTSDRGDKLLKTLANLINVEFKSMVNARFDESEITFQILPSAGINITELVKKIETMKNKFAKKTGYTIDFVSIGDKAKTPSVMMSSTYEDSKNFEWIFMSVAAVCAVVASAAALLIIRRHSRYKNKFEGLIGSSAEVSKDYQELCRARMSNKKEEPNAASQRIASLSKDPDNSPSSRSSTSSWGEEPVLSNMDISTGHMVLAYMEDHLNNKNRLDSEWAALCAYEAEPCAVNVARKDQQITWTNNDQSSQAIIKKTLKTTTEIQLAMTGVISTDRGENTYPEILPNSLKEEKIATNIRQKIRDCLMERKGGKGDEDKK